MAVRNVELAVGDRARRRGVRQDADPVRPARIGNPERRPRGRAASGGGSLRRSRLRARRLAGLAPQAGLGHPRRRRRRRARGADGQRAHGRRDRRLDRAARGRHHLRARRHAGLRRPRRENPRRPRSRRHHRQSDWSTRDHQPSALSPQPLSPCDRHVRLVAGGRPRARATRSSPRRSAGCSIRST